MYSIIKFNFAMEHEEYINRRPLERRRSIGSLIIRGCGRIASVQNRRNLRNKNAPARYIRR